MINLISCATMIICTLVVLRTVTQQSHPLLSVLSGTACSLGVLVLLAITEPTTGVALPLNRFTLFISAVLGVPGVISLLLLQLLF